MKKLLAIPLMLLLALLPVQAMAASVPADGRYTAEVRLSGGTGRASVASPAEITVSGGKAEARIVWSSPYYEYMRLDGITYYPIQSEGNAAFQIPVELDTDIPFTAQTVAMSVPHEISYTLHIEGATLRALRENLPAGALLAGGAALFLFVAAAGFLLLERRKKQNGAGRP